MGPQFTEPVSAQQLSIQYFQQNYDLIKPFGAGDNQLTEPVSVQQSSIQHCRQKYHLIKRLGAGDNGEAYAAIHKADAAEIAADHDRRRTSAYFADLRNSVVAIKFPKDVREENDLAAEINMLKNVLPKKLGVFTYAMDSHLSADVQYLALPFVSGGNLQSFAEEHSDALTLGFRYHVASSLAKGMLYVLYGITDGSDTPAPGWPRIAHSDLYACNILLAPEGGYNDYPKIVIADFGRAVWYGYGTNPYANELYCKKALNDVETLGSVLEDLTDYYDTETENEPDRQSEQSEQDETWFRGWMEPFLSIDYLLPATVEEVQGYCIAFLHHAAQTGQSQRMKFYQPLPSAAHAALHTVKISDGLLQSAIPL